MAGRSFIRVSGQVRNEDQPARGANNVIRATPYEWRDPASIAKREWLYGYLLVRKFVSATVSPGGVGKSSLIVAEALAAVSGKDLLGVAPRERLRVWLWNLEDPQEETERKVQATALHYGLCPDDIADRLYADSGRDQPLVIATTGRNGAMIARPVVEGLISEIKARRIDVVVIDPFVSSHEVGENDNTAMDIIVKEWGKVAQRSNCAVHLVHHTRKMTGVETEVTTDSSRGGKALTDGCRVVRAVSRASPLGMWSAGNNLGTVPSLLHGAGTRPAIFERFCAQKNQGLLRKNDKNASIRKA